MRGGTGRVQIMTDWIRLVRYVFLRMSKLERLLNFSAKVFETSRLKRSFLPEDFDQASCLRLLTSTHVIMSASPAPSPSTAQGQPLAPTDRGFLRHLQHETRTPLTSIIGFAQLLQEAAPTDARAFGECIERAGHRLSHVLHQVTLLLQAVNGSYTSRDIRWNPAEDLLAGIDIAEAMQTLLPATEVSKPVTCKALIRAEVEETDEFFLCRDYFRDIVHTAVESATRHLIWRTMQYEEQMGHLSLSVSYVDEMLIVNVCTSPPDAASVASSGDAAAKDIAYRVQKDISLAPSSSSGRSPRSIPFPTSRASTVEDTLLHMLAEQLNGAASVNVSPDGVHAARIAIPVARRSGGATRTPLDHRYDAP